MVSVQRFHTIRCWYRAGPTLPRLVLFLAVEAEHQSGPDMLIEQAGLSFKLWTGLEAPIDSMYSVLSKKT